LESREQEQKMFSIGVLLRGRSVVNLPIGSEFPAEGDFRIRKRNNWGKRATAQDQVLTPSGILGQRKRSAIKRGEVRIKASEVWYSGHHLKQEVDLRGQGEKREKKDLRQRRDLALGREKLCHPERQKGEGTITDKGRRGGEGSRGERNPWGGDPTRVVVD